MAKPQRTELRKQIDKSAREIDQELSEFREAAAVMSSAHPRLIDEYPKQWVGVYRGVVEAHGSSLTAVVEQLNKKRIPAEKVMVRYIDKNERTLIL